MYEVASVRLSIFGTVRLAVMKQADTLVEATSTMHVNVLVKSAEMYCMWESLLLWPRRHSS